MGLEKIREQGNIVRFRSSADIGNIIDLDLTPIPRGEMGVGIVHHIAWRAIDDNDHLEWRDYVKEQGYGVTPAKDCNYFNAILILESMANILFEIATDPPGFAYDESQETMGEKLMLPSQYYLNREKIGKNVIPIEVRNLDKKD